MHKGLLDRRSLRAEDGVKYFKDTSKPQFIKGAQSAFLCRFYQFIRARRKNIEMVKWIGKFSLLLERLRDAWMDMLLMTATKEQVTSHERLFPFSDNLTTLMFIGASDLSEAQRELLTSSLSLKGVNVAAYTSEAVKTVFVELFCMPKSSMDNLSLRVYKKRVQHEQNLRRRSFC